MNLALKREIVVGMGSKASKCHPKWYSQFQKKGARGSQQSSALWAIPVHMGHLLPPTPAWGLGEEARLCRRAALVGWAPRIR